MRRMFSLRLISVIMTCSVLSGEGSRQNRISYGHCNFSNNFSVLCKNGFIFVSSRYTGTTMETNGKFNSSVKSIHQIIILFIIILSYIKFQCSGNIFPKFRGSDIIHRIKQIIHSGVRENYLIITERGVRNINLTELKNVAEVY